MVECDDKCECELPGRPSRGVPPCRPPGPPAGGSAAPAGTGHSGITDAGCFYFCWPEDGNLSDIAVMPFLPGPL